MTFQATTRVRLGVKAGDDAYGEPTGDTAPADDAPSYRAAITEKTRTVIDPTSGEARTVRYAVGRVDPGCPADDQSTLHTTEGRVYIVDEVTREPRSMVGRSDVLLSLRITSGE